MRAPSYSVLAPLGERGAKPEANSPPWSGLHPGANVQRIIKFGTFAILLVFGGLGTWATVAPLSGAVIGSGVVKVDLNRKTVQHLEGGIVREIRVRDGDQVEAGQVLIVIADERVDASVDVLQGQLDAELAKAARLAAERDSLEQLQFPEALTSRRDDPKVAELIGTETSFFDTRRRALAEQVALLEEQIEESHKEIKSLRMRADAEQAAAGLLRQEIAAHEQLEKQHYVRKMDILRLKRGIEEYKARRGEHLADIARAEQRISNLKLRIASSRDKYLQDAAEGLTAAQARIFDLQERLRPSIDMQRRQHILAPISGTVVNMSVFTVGGVITPREPLMDIVPEDNLLIVEAQIPVDAIDDIILGQDADVRLSAYKRRSTPLVSGKVTYVSADRLTDSRTNESYYLIHVSVDRRSLDEAGNLSLYPGMPAEVYIRTGERTALDYMLSPVTATLRRAAREP